MLLWRCFFFFLSSLSCRVREATNKSISVMFCSLQIFDLVFVAHNSASQLFPQFSFYSSYLHLSPSPLSFSVVFMSLFTTAVSITAEWYHCVLIAQWECSLANGSKIRAGMESKRSPWQRWSRLAHDASVMPPGSRVENLLVSGDYHILGCSSSVWKYNLESRNCFFHPQCEFHLQHSREN